MKRILTILLSFISAPAFAQYMPMQEMEDTIIVGVHFEGYFDWAIPILGFKDRMHQQGIGVGGQVLYNVQGPVWIGMGVHTFRFDHFKISYYEYDDGERYEIEEITATRAIMGHLIMRFQPIESEIFKPYLQAGAGWHWFYTNTKLTDVEYDEQIDSFSEFRDSRFGYGIHAGVLITPRAMTNVGVDIRFGYLSNASVEFLASDPEERRYQGGFPADYFELESSPVELLNLNVGIVARF